MGKKISALLAILGAAALILDTKTALIGAKDGIELCITTVIPSLFPFFVLSGVITSSISEKKIPALSSFCRWMKIPDHALPLILVGLLGGYPIGAKAVAQARQQGELDFEAAQRMSVICNQAGPSFLFGMVASAFESRWTGWLLWGILILSTVATALLLPGKLHYTSASPIARPMSFPQAMTQALRAIANVCGWVILFRVLIIFLNRWLLWMLPQQWQVTWCGLLELTNGCVMLRQVSNTGLRLILASLFLSFGGLCVMLQTTSVLEPTGITLWEYFPGKCLQSAVSMIIAIVAQFLLPAEERISAQAIAMLLPIFLVFLAIYSIHVYNGQKHTNRRWHLCFSERKSPVPANIVNLQR